MVSTIRRAWVRVSLSLACAVMASCSLSSLAHDDRPLPNDVDQVPVLREAVVPTLLPLITAAGLFAFPVPNVAVDEMPLDTALVQAREYLFYALNIGVIRGTAEGQRGAFIDLGKLVACNRPQLLPSAYERPADSVPRPIRLQVGASWSIPFCGTRQTPEVIVTVATLGNKVRYENGRPVADSANGHFAFQVRGIRWEWRAEHAVTAEEAVNEVYAVTGVRAARLPELANAAQINGRFVTASGPCPVWRVGLERPVRVAAAFSLRRLDVAEVFVADSDCPGVLGRTVVLTPWAEQPATREFRVSVRDSLSTTGFRNEVYLARLRAPVTFESAIIER